MRVFENEDRLCDPSPKAIPRLSVGESTTGRILCVHACYPPYGEPGKRALGAVLIPVDEEPPYALRTLYLSHKDLLNKLRELNPERGDYIIIENRGKVGKSFTYHVAKDDRLHEKPVDDVLCPCIEPNV